MAWPITTQIGYEYARSQKYPYPFVNGSLVWSSYVPQAPFFGKNDVPRILKTCNSPVELFLRPAGAFFPAKMAFLGFLGHVMILLRSSYGPQALFFFAKMTILGSLGHVMALLRSSYVPQAPFFRQK